jgi:hypothetical protein
MTHTWSIDTLKRNDGSDIVTSLVWTLSSVDNLHSNKISGKELPLDNISEGDEGYISYNSLTEDICKSWLFAKVSQSEMESKNVAIINVMASGSGIVAGTPW